MTDSEALRARIKARGLKLGFIAQQIGVSFPTLSKKINGLSDFTQSEIKIISKILGLTDREMNSIFFA